MLSEGSGKGMQSMEGDLTRHLCLTAASHKQESHDVIVQAGAVSTPNTLQSPPPANPRHKNRDL
eukprot:78239-Ditylum_brightwellii.AAC.1